jgi:hypothetical protein
MRSARARACAREHEVAHAGSALPAKRHGGVGAIFLAGLTVPAMEVLVLLNQRLASCQSNAHYTNGGVALSDCPQITSAVILRTPRRRRRQSHHVEVQPPDRRSNGRGPVESDVSAVLV